MIENQSIERLIDEDFLYAKVLDYFGVAFYHTRHKTLKEVCACHHIDLEDLTAMLAHAQSLNPTQIAQLRSCPAGLIVAYLKHSHQLFIKDRLPFILRHIHAQDTDLNSPFVNDLRTVLPLFVQDFIHHIYEEEDRLFSHIIRLENVVNGQAPPMTLGESMDGFSIVAFASHHHQSDDEMKGIRGLTNNYQTRTIDNIRLRVVFQSLKAFDEELALHASIENDILIPKALDLESKAKAMLAYALN